MCRETGQTRDTPRGADTVQGETPQARFARLRSLQDETLEAIRARGGGISVAETLPRDALYKRDA